MSWFSYERIKRKSQREYNTVTARLMSQTLNGHKLRMTGSTADCTFTLPQHPSYEMVVLGY